MKAVVVLDKRQSEKRIDAIFGIEDTSTWELEDIKSQYENFSEDDFLFIEINADLFKLVDMAENREGK